MVKNILFVDDEVFLVGMMKHRLEANGYKMSGAYDGENALYMAKRDKPDLIILDNILPKLDGASVCARLKSDPDTKSIPVILISAIDKDELSKKSLEIGADDFLFKPYESEELLMKIEKFIGK